MQKILVSLLSVSAFLFAVSVAAVTGVAEWDTYRSDLVRCASTTAYGHPACGSTATGTNPLEEGYVSMNDDDVRVRLEEASKNTTYKLGFITLHNTGTDATGPYMLSEMKILGQFRTNRHGDASERFKNTKLAGPTLGYFVIQRSSDSTNQFATGFSARLSSPSPTPGPYGPYGPTSSATPDPYGPYGPTPSVTPTVTPEVTPTVTPSPTPTVTPEVTPSPTPV